MELNKKEAYDLAIQIVKEGKCSDESLKEEHITRDYTLKAVSSDKYNLTIHRHPQIFGRESKGMLSSAFITLEKTYELNISKKSLVLIKEEVIDIEIDYSALADEDISIIFDYYSGEVESKLNSLDSEQAVEIFAEEDFIGFDWQAGYEPEDYNWLPKDFWKNLKMAQKEAFKNALIEEWKSLRII